MVHPDAIEIIKKRLAEGENPRDIKMELALEITALYHSKEAALSAQEHFKTAFQQGVAPADSVILTLNSNTPDAGFALVDALMETGAYKSKSDIRRLFQQGAVKINNERAPQDLKAISTLPAGTIIQIGKGAFYKIG